MELYRTHMIAALLSAAALVPLGAAAQQQPAGSVTTPSGAPARPRDSTSNLPSDSGSQTTTPAGAATGAGQPQGRTRQPDVGSPGGLERRARANERASAAGAGTSAVKDGTSSATARVDAPRRQRTNRSRTPRASRG